MRWSRRCARRPPRGFGGREDWPHGCRSAPTSARYRAEKALAPLSRDKLGIVLVGVSTGGPGTLEEILPQLPAGFPWPVVVAQHMPSTFTGVFARRLASLCAVPVTEVTRQTVMEGGNVYIARGDADLVFTKTGLGMMALPAPASAQHLWHPSVTRMVESAMNVMPPERLVGVQLTGMGDDGAKAMANLRSRGGRTIAQDEASSVVFGMPGELVKLGGADVVLPAQVHRQATDVVADARRGGDEHSMEARHGSR